MCCIKDTFIFTFYNENMLIISETYHIKSFKY
nr:MAG TPA: hypothetical protein [Caudoviricetes sp.]